MLGYNSLKETSISAAILSEIHSIFSILWDKETGDQMALCTVKRDEGQRKIISVPVWFALSTPFKGCSTTGEINTSLNPSQSGLDVELYKRITWEQALQTCRDLSLGSHNSVPRILVSSIPSRPEDFNLSSETVKDMAHFFPAERTVAFMWLHEECQSLANQK